MPTPQQITNRILRGQLLQASLAKSFVQQETVGNFYNYWDKSVYISELVEGLSTQYGKADYTSTTTINIYNKLGGQIGMQFIDGASLDPNAQPIGQIISINVPVVLGYNQGKIPFTSTEDSPVVQLLDYHNQYYPLYGNNPTLGLYDNQGAFIGDEQTPPRITYSTPGDASTDIVSILWDLPPNPGTTTGYVQISGASPVQASGSGGTGNTITLTFTQASLINGGTVDEPNWYLPLTLPTNKNPVYVTINGVGQAMQYDKNFVPPRLWGFANNDTQTIIVSVI